MYMYIYTRNVLCAVCMYTYIHTYIIYTYINILQVRSDVCEVGAEGVCVCMCVYVYCVCVCGEG